MRFWFPLLLLLVTLFFTACQPVSDDITIISVLASENATDVDDDVPSNVLKIIKKDRKNQRAWQALHHYSSITDAGITLSFYGDCFNAIKDDPLLFFDRYMAGDEQALFRMVDALSHDFSAFQETFEQTDRVFRRAFNLIAEFELKHARERQYQRADNFYRVSQAQYQSWKLRYCEFVRKESEIVATNCAPWEKR